VVLLLAAPLYGQGTRKQGPLVVAGERPIQPMASSATITYSPPAGVSFTAPNPSTSPIVSGNSPLTVTITLGGSFLYRAWNLQIQALGDLTSPTGTIPIGSISWTATGSVVSCPWGGCSISVVSGSHPLTTTNVQTATGTEALFGGAQFRVVYNFTFTDSWDYVPTTYTQQALLTVNAP